MLTILLVALTLLGPVALFVALIGRLLLGLARYRGTSD